MLWFRMIGVAWRLAWPYLLTPWRSPLLRWRIETYGMLDDRGHLVCADDVNASTFLRFTLHHRKPLCRFLRWASLL